MWKEFFKQVKEDEGTEKGASLFQVLSYDRKVKDKFGVGLPKAYKEFLRLSNGMMYNGHNIYGIRGEDESYMDMLQQTEFFGSEDWAEKYLFFGDSDMDMYVYDTENKTYEVQDTGGETWESFDTCEELLEYILKSSLDLLENDEDEEE